MRTQTAWMRDFLQFLFRVCVAAMSGRNCYFDLFTLLNGLSPAVNRVFTQRDFTDAAWHLLTSCNMCQLRSYHNHRSIHLSPSPPPAIVIIIIILCRCWCVKSFHIRSIQFILLIIIHRVITILLSLGDYFRPKIIWTNRMDGDTSASAWHTNIICRQLMDFLFFPSSTVHFISKLISTENDNVDRNWIIDCAHESKENLFEWDLELEILCVVNTSFRYLFNEIII